MLEVVVAAATTPLEELSTGAGWDLCAALLTLHAIADEACAGLGVALAASNPLGCGYRGRARELLAQRGTLARISQDAVLVLPKVRTPAAPGTSIRSMSRYATAHEPSVGVRWHKLPARRRGTEPRADHVNFLLLPWPLQIRASDFRPIEGSAQRDTDEPYGFFDFDPAERLDLDLVDRMLVAARLGHGRPVPSTRTRCRTGSRPVEGPQQRLQRDPSGVRAQGILLTACVSPAQRRSNDGRRPVHNAVDLYAVGQHQIRPAATGSQDGAPVRQLSDPPPLNVDDLTILCGWAEAVAEALAYAPSRVAAVLSDAAAGSPWRATLGLNEPSDRLRKAIQLMDDVVNNTAATSDHLDAIRAAVSDDIASADDALTGLVRRVLLAALELREGRRRHEEDHRVT